MSRDSQRHYTIDDYFTVEEMSEVKHEYYNGEIFAMAGASLEHNEIAANVLSGFRAALLDTDCGVYASDLRILTPAGLYSYPDQGSKVSLKREPVKMADIVRQNTKPHG